MKRVLIRILLAILVIATLFMLFLAFTYFRVDNRVKAQTETAGFKNGSVIKRLDSTSIPADSITAYITELMQRVNVHGMGVSVINDNKLVYQQYFGWRNKQKKEHFVPGTILYSASFSKTVLADVVLQLAEDNILQLDTPLYKYLPEPLATYKTSTFMNFFGATSVDYTDLAHDERYKKITARMCLSHTTGFPNWRWFEDDDKLKIKFEPGSRYNYSGEGMYLLQFVLEQLTNKSFETLAFEKVFEPLHMQRSSYVWQREYEGNYAVGHDSLGNFLGIPKRNVPNAAASMSTTLEEYTHYFLSVLQQKELRYQLLTTPQIRIRSKQQFGPNAGIDTNDNDSIELSYGLGYGLYKTPYGNVFFKEGHDDGWQHYAVGFPEQGVALVIMANSENAESIFKELIEYTTGNTYTPWFWEHYIPYNI